MILGSIVAGPWAGSGLAGLEQGKDFNCTSTICYGITKTGESSPGAVTQSFVNLQRAINRWSGKAGFTSVGVDGKIGAATVEALQKAGGAMLSTLPGALATVAQNLFAKNLTKENVAASAVALTDSLNSGADKLEAAGALPAPRVSTTSQGPSSPGSSNTGIVPPTSPGAFAPPESKSNLVWWLIGGFTVVAVAGVTTAVVMKRRKNSPSSRKPRAAIGGRRAAAY